ncbi:MAG: hypothetical protein M1818_007033 [Claussenomyces sp. TS43310]|nr:MAG: hypothetical protein M1818_007033 [Claussenomyces sp. TS43310]
MGRVTSISALHRKAKFSFRAFYITSCLISAFAVLSLAADQVARYRYGDQYGVTQSMAAAELDVARLVKRDEECRLVHHASDKCAFIKANCPDEEAGLISYLSLYYCALPKAQPVAFIILVLWLGLLFSTIGIAASDFFCINLSTIASILGMSESMAGVTFLAFGNGSPDVFSTFAAMSSHSGSLAVGELIGAAGFITAVVAGSMALVREFKVGKKTFVRDVGFFIVAASFSMVFLADGSLHLWECCAMIGFYLFYVVVVVVWHWYLNQRRKRRDRYAAARGHYHVPNFEEIEVQEEDGDEEDAPAIGDSRSSRERSVEDLGILERGTSPGFGGGVESGDESDSEGHQGRLLAAEMTNNMRVVRPRGNRRSTINPIRPSLVGAMEFRSVLASLQKSRSSDHRPIHLRRYSDDPVAFSDQATTPTIAENTRDPFDTYENGTAEATQTPAHIRMRAVSMNDVEDPRDTDPAAYSVATVPAVGVDSTQPFPRHLVDSGDPISGSHSGPASLAGDAGDAGVTGSSTIPPSPSISISGPSSEHAIQDASLGPSHRKFENKLTIPNGGFPGAHHLQTDLRSNEPSSIAYSQTAITAQQPREPSKLIIPHSRDSSGHSLSPISQFPLYTDSPASLKSSGPPSLLLPDSGFTPQISHSPVVTEEEIPRPIKWWPYHLLPDPWNMLAILFPTLNTWRDKSIIDKILSVVSTPSIFLLAITLPVVETESQEEEAEEVSHDTVSRETRRRRSTTTPRLPPDSPYLDAPEESEWQHYRRTLSQEHGAPSQQSPAPRGFAGHGSTAQVAVATEISHDHNHLQSPRFSFSSKQNSPPAEAGISPSRQGSNQPKDWNRWLLTVQIFTAPLFVVLIIWANSPDSQDKLDLGYLRRLVLYSLLGSLLTFAILLITTTADRPPKYRALFCFLGFVVSISWISTIANEVVGVLKALGVILGISDAILGLTIFAVGNSLGDLVADITVARLGYPVMALSACFGGPMLNILLGIGISGLYMTISEAKHKHEKHPGRPLKYKPYQVEVSGSLMVSGIILLITLVGLLIVVPLNKWVMSRRIGWGLIILWSIGTIVNLVVEVTGVWGDDAQLYM